MHDTTARGSSPRPERRADVGAASDGVESADGGSSGEAAATPPQAAAPPPAAAAAAPPVRPSQLKRLQDALEGCDTDVAVEIALCAMDQEYRPSKATVTKLISQLSKTGAWRRGLAVFKSLHILEVEIDLSLANAALWACKRGGDAAEAWRIFTDIATVVGPADTISLRALFPVLQARRMWEQSVLAFTVAFRDGLHLDGQACLFLLCTLRRAGLWQLAEACLLAELCRQLRLEALPALAATLARMPLPPPRGAAATATAQLLMRTVVDLTAAVVRPATAAGDGSGRARLTIRGGGGGGYRGTSARALDCGRIAEARGGLVGDALATQCCNVLLQAYAEASPPQPARALAFISTMYRVCASAPHRNLQPDVLSCGIVAIAHCRAGLVQKGLSMLPSAAVAGDRRTPAPVFATCMAMAASAGDQAAVLAAWRHMGALCVLPNDACRTAFIRQASRSHDPDTCLEAVNCALALSQQASAAPIVQREVGRLLVSLAQHGTPASAVTGFQRVLGAGLPVPEDSVRDCVRELARRDDQCCAALRQTAAVAGFGIAIIC